MTTATPTGSDERRPADERSDLLHGTENIAGYLGLTVRQVERHIAQSSLPVFRLGRTVCARRSSLDSWLSEVEHRTRRAG
jgi:excisionase family DNA binding protein